MSLQKLGGIRMVTKHQIRLWLENYEHLHAGDYSFLEEGNSGPGPDDGVSSMFLNKIMLDCAIKELSLNHRLAVKMRWVWKKPTNKACRTLGVSRASYFRYCREAVDVIHKKLNRITTPV